MTKSSWLSMNFVFLLAAMLLPEPASAYRILIIPQPAKSHILSLATIAENLADRGHQVVFFVGEDFALNLPELSNGSSKLISVVRHTGTTTIDETSTKPLIESQGNIMHLASVINKMYVKFT